MAVTRTPVWWFSLTSFRGDFRGLKEDLPLLPAHRGLNKLAKNSGTYII